MSTAKPIPIIVTGGTEKIGSVVVASMKPEYEVIHFTLAAKATNEIPLLLKGEVPSPSSSSLGSGNWSVFPKAILFGGAYKDEMIEDVRGAVAKTAGTKRIPWLRVDSNLPHPPLGPEYGTAIVERAKAMLGKLDSEGKLDTFIREATHAQSKSFSQDFYGLRILDNPTDAAEFSMEYNVFRGPAALLLPTALYYNSKTALHRYKSQ